MAAHSAPPLPMAGHPMPTLYPMHLEVIFQLLMCGPDAATSVVCTSGLEIEFYPNLRMSSLALLKAEIPYPL